MSIALHRSMPLRGDDAGRPDRVAEVSRGLELPDGTLRPRSREAWHAAYLASAFRLASDTTQRSGVKQRTARDRLDAVVGVFAGAAHAWNLTTAPGHQVLARHVGVSQVSIKRYVRALVDAGLLVRLSAGRSAELPGTDGRALRAVYLLTIPSGDPRSHDDADSPTERLRHAADRADTPKESPEGGSIDLHAHARRPHDCTEAFPNGNIGRTRPTGHRYLRTPRPSPRRRARHKRYDLAQAICAKVPGLQTTQSAYRAVAAELREFVDAGWSIDDVLWAIHHTPERPRPSLGQAAIRHPGRWIAWVLSEWRDASNSVIASRTQRRHMDAMRRVERRQQRANDASQRAAARALLVGSPETVLARQRAFASAQRRNGTTQHKRTHATPAAPDLTKDLARNPSGLATT